MSASLSNRPLCPAREGDKSSLWTTLLTHSGLFLSGIPAKPKAIKKNYSPVQPVFTSLHFNILFASPRFWLFLCKKICHNHLRHLRNFTPNDCFASPPLECVLQYIHVCGREGVCVSVHAWLQAKK